MRQRERSALLGLIAALAAGLLSGCTEAADPTTAGADRSPAPASPPPLSAPTAVAPAAIATEGEELTCGEPPVQLLDWAGVAADSDPGPVAAAVVVFAATTDTGDWYVLGMDRLAETDAGETTPGDGTRTLALTNAVTGPDEPKIIPLWHESLERPADPSWDAVIWTGETLAAGERAAARAVECLDGAAG